MKKIIVMTTINSPTEAVYKYCNKKGWDVLIIGDLKTPHDDFRELETKYSHVTYMSPEDQTKKYPTLSKVLGWNCYERKNIGFLEAYKNGYHIMANVDDDNIPYEHWGQSLLVGRIVTVDLYESEYDVFDPLMNTNRPDMWHRGFPIDKVKDRNSFYRGKKTIECLIQADLWDGEPDVDAICKLTKDYNVKFDNFSPFTSSKIMPFNSQNSFIHRKILPYYMMLLDTERMADIWGAYVAQKLFKNNNPYVIIHPSTVYHDRQDKPSPAATGTNRSVIEDFRVETQGYLAASDFLVDSNWKNYLTEKSLKALEIYQNCFLGD